jgi:hypothetical protein
MAVKLQCPTCHRAIAWSDEYPCRPFCSERCRLIDLGAWLSEQRAISGNEAEIGESDPPPDEAAREL